jgi:hypothetical protein
MPSGELLIKQLEEIAGRTDLPFERRLIDTAVWFHKNKDSIPRDDLTKRLDFMEKTFDIVIELMALSLDRVQQVERGSSQLFLPKGMSMKGNLKHFG